MSKIRPTSCFASALIIAAVALGSSFAVAADMSEPAPVYSKAPIIPAVSWTGFYLGAGVGLRSANVTEQTLSAAEDGFSLMSPVECHTLLCGGAQSLDNTAFRFAPYFGYNWQILPQWLVGLEGDVGFGSKTSSINGVPLPAAGLFNGEGNVAGDSFAVKTSWDASARARVGYLVTPDFLIYATGGPAWQHVEATSTCGPNNFFACGTGSFTPTVTDSTTKLGWTVGGGIESLVWGHWLVRGELRYSDFGAITNTDVRQEEPLGHTVITNYKLNLTTETALVGAAYKF
jgi:outer membrane immunogenic protein